MWPCLRPATFLYDQLLLILDVYILYILSVDKLAGNTGKTGPVFCWDLILIYVSIKWLQGGGTGSQGLLNIMRQFLWIKIQQYTTREIQVKIMFSSSDVI